MENNENKIFEILESSIRNAIVENFNIYEICKENEKLTIFKLANNDISFKVFKNSTLLKYCKMKKTKDIIEIRNINNIEETVKEKFNNIKYSSNNLYLRIFIDNINDIQLLSNEIAEIFKTLFIQYINNEENFGCCSKFVQCSDNLKCVNDDIRLRLSCMYKKNLDNGRIFYGKNKNI